MKPTTKKRGPYKKRRKATGDVREDVVIGREDIPPVNAANLAGAVAQIRDAFTRHDEDRKLLEGVAKDLGKIVDRFSPDRTTGIELTHVSVSPETLERAGIKPHVIERRDIAPPTHRSPASPPAAKAAKAERIPIEIPDGIQDRDRKILEGWNAGLSYREIASEAALSQQGASNVVAKYRNGGSPGASRAKRKPEDDGFDAAPPVPSDRGRKATCIDCDRECTIAADVDIMDVKCPGCKGPLIEK
jgi:hypothetical protein